MKKDLGVKPYLFPMPVLMIATYNDDGTVDMMNMAWGGICANNMVALNIGEGHKTAANIKTRKAFTLSVADIDHLEAADFFGIASGNKMADKFARSGLHAVSSTRCDAPIVEEFPVTLEYKVADIQPCGGELHIVGDDLIPTSVTQTTLEPFRWMQHIVHNCFQRDLVVGMEWRVDA